MSDRALRGLAYAVMALCVASSVAAVVLSLVSPPSASSWGSGSVVVRVASVLTTVAFGVAGLLVAQREPRNRIGWLMLAIGATWSWSLMADGYILYGLATRPGSLPAPELVAALSSWSWIPAIGLLGVFLILLFPDGHLPSPRWRWLAWTAGAAIVLSSASIMLAVGTIDDVSVDDIDNPLAVESLSAVTELLGWSLLVLPVAVLLSAVSLVVRYRRARGVERLQLKWLATAGALVAVIFVAAMTGSLLLDRDAAVPGWLQLVQDAVLVSFLAIPVAIGIAILKHRLYGIDVVLNKSVVFGALAGFITVVYVGIVVGVGSLVGRGDSPSLVLSIAATTVVAVAFQGVRARVQRFANRLVYGDRATPYEVLSDFADRMGGAYATAELLPMMARTVGQGVGAADVGVWLAGSTGLVREAGWSPDPERSHGAGAVSDLAALDGDFVAEVRHGGELLGAISVRKPPGEQVTPTEAKLLEDVASQAGLVLRNVRLIEELRSSTQRLVRAQDEERRRLERNLHDGAQQSLVAVALMIRMIRARLDGASGSAGPTLDQAAEQLSAAIDELRVLARGIHPAILSERGLAAAVGSLAERSPVPVVVRYRLDERPPPELEATSYYVVAEALANVAKHAQANEVEVEVSSTGTELVVEVSDDGVGGCDQTRGTGLLGLADRVSVVDGSLTVTSPPGQGTRLVCRLPLPPTARSTPVAPTQQRPTEPLGAGL